MSEMMVRLIFWDSWLLSSSVFSAGLVLLASCLRWSLLSVTATLLLYTFLASLGYKLYVHLMGFMKKPCRDILTELQKFEIDEKDVEKVLCKASHKLKIIVDHGLALLFAHDIEKSAKFCLFLYLLTYLGSICDTLSLLIICWIGLFSLPPLFTQYKPQLDYFSSKLRDLKKNGEKRLAGSLQRTRKHTRFVSKEK